MKRDEIDRIRGKVEQRGYTLVPLPRSTSRRAGRRSSSASRRGVQRTGATPIAERETKREMDRALRRGAEAVAAGAPGRYHRGNKAASQLRRVSYWRQFDARTSRSRRMAAAPSASAAREVRCPTEKRGAGSPPAILLSETFAENTWSRRPPANRISAAGLRRHAPMSRGGASARGPPCARPTRCRTRTLPRRSRDACARGARRVGASPPRAVLPPPRAPVSRARNGDLLTPAIGGRRTRSARMISRPARDHPTSSRTTRGAPDSATSGPWMVSVVLAPLSRNHGRSRPRARDDAHRDAAGSRRPRRSALVHGSEQRGGGSLHDIGMRHEPATPSYASASGSGGTTRPRIAAHPARGRVPLASVLSGAHPAVTAAQASWRCGWGYLRAQRCALPLDGGRSPSRAVRRPPHPAAPASASIRTTREAPPTCSPPK